MKYTIDPATLEQKLAEKFATNVIGKDWLTAQLTRRLHELQIQLMHLEMMLEEPMAATRPILHDLPEAAARGEPIVKFSDWFNPAHPAFIQKDGAVNHFKIRDDNFKIWSALNFEIDSELLRRPDEKKERPSSAGKKILIRIKDKPLLDLICGGDAALAEHVFAGEVRLIDVLTTRWPESIGNMTRAADALTDGPDRELETKLDALVEKTIEDVRLAFEPGREHLERPVRERKTAFKGAEKYFSERLRHYPGELSRRHFEHFRPDISRKELDSVVQRELRLEPSQSLRR